MSKTRNDAVTSITVLMGEIAAISQRRQEPIEKFGEAIVAMSTVLARALVIADAEHRERDPASPPLGALINLSPQLVAMIERYNAIPVELNQIGTLEALNLAAAIGEQVARLVKVQRS